MLYAQVPGNGVAQGMRHKRRWKVLTPGISIGNRARRLEGEVWRQVQMFRDLRPFNMHAAKRAAAVVVDLMLDTGGRM